VRSRRESRDHPRSYGSTFVATFFKVVWDLLEVITGAKMAVNGAQQRITETLTQWPGIIVAPHRFGGVEYRLGTREIGHIHGETLLDIPFPTAVRNELIASGVAHPHHILPESGWISYYIRKPEDILQALELLQRSYQIAQQQAARRPRQKANHGK
jgi:hypothetical protein